MIYGTVSRWHGPFCLYLAGESGVESLRQAHGIQTQHGAEVALLLLTAFVEVRDRRVTSVGLADGSRIACGHLVDAAGPWAPSVAKHAGVELRVFARRRTVYVVACREVMTPFPLLIDTSGFWIRPEGQTFIAGLPPGEDPDDVPLEPEYDLFESVLWPALAARMPAFNAAKLECAWAGYYEIALSGNARQ